MTDKDLSLDRLLKRTAQLSAAPDGPCPDAEELAAFASGTLRTAARDVCEAHVSGCVRCLQLLAAMARSEEAAPASVAWWRPANWTWWLVPVTAAATAVALWVNVGPDRQQQPVESQIASSASDQRASEQERSAPAAAAPSPSDSATRAPAAIDELRRKSAELAKERANVNEEKRQIADAFRSRDFESARKDAAPRREAADDKVAANKPAEGNRVAQEAVPALPAPPVAPPPVSAPVTVTAEAPPPPPPTAGAGAGGRGGAKAVATPPAPQQSTQQSAQQTTQQTTQQAARQQAQSELRQRDQVTQDRVAANFRDAAAPIDIPSPDPAIKWRVSNVSIERTTNGGATWTAQFTAPAPLLAGSSASPTVAWVVGRGGTVLLSTDGQRWLRTPFPEPIDLVGVRARSDREADVTAADGRVFRTSDGGKNWRLQEPQPRPF